jgi:hypothetical protein
MVMPYEAMMETIYPRQHCAWFKALLVLNLLQRCFSPGVAAHSFCDSTAQEYLSLPAPQAPRGSVSHTPSSPSSSAQGEAEESSPTDGGDGDDNAMFAKYKYLLWIDADAAVIGQEQPLQSFLQQAHAQCDLLISEDMGGEEGGSSCCPINTGGWV